jgi:hypothetical protein
MMIQLYSVFDGHPHVSVRTQLNAPCKFYTFDTAPLFQRFSTALVLVSNILQFSPRLFRIAGYELNYHTSLPHRNHTCIHHLGWEVPSPGA